MNVHKNARLTPYRRQELVALVERGTALTVAAQAFGVSRQTARKWVMRKDSAAVVEDGAWLQDRSSPAAYRAPGPRSQRSSSGPRCCAGQRWSMRGDREGGRGERGDDRADLAARRPLARLRLEPPPMGRRYEHPAPGDLLHLDTKKLGRIRGIGHRIYGQRQYRARGIGSGVFCASRSMITRGSAYMELLDDERGPPSSAFLRRALRWFRARGVRVRRVLTDNGSGYLSRSFRATCRGLQVVHRRTRPYTPRTNGRPSGSFRPPSANGRTTGPSTPPRIAGG